MARKNSSRFIRQRLELLALNDNFNSAVLEFRKKWEIPRKGFYKNKTREKWSRMMDTKEGNVYSEEFSKKMERLYKRKTQALKNGDKRLYDKMGVSIFETNKEIPINGFYADIDGILKKFKLSQYYRENIKHFMLVNKFDMLPNDNLALCTHDKNKNIKLSLEIYANTTIKDVQNIWEIIRYYQKKMPEYQGGRCRTSNYFDRDKRIYQLYKEGLKSNEIAKIIHDERGGRKLGYDEINIIKLRMKKKINNN